MNDTDYLKVYRLIVKLRNSGASIRGIAKAYGMSKSNLQRLLPAIEATVASQMGQDGDTGAAKSASSEGDPVPNGTRGEAA